MVGGGGGYGLGVQGIGSKVYSIGFRFQPPGVWGWGFGGLGFVHIYWVGGGGGGGGGWWWW